MSTCTAAPKKALRRIHRHMDLIAYPVTPRTGRPRKLDAKRQPDGRVAYPRDETRMQALSTVIAQRKKIALANACLKGFSEEDQRFGTVRGRLWMEHEASAHPKTGDCDPSRGITQGMHDAAQKFAESAAKHQRAICAPPPVPTAPGQSQGSTDPDSIFCLDAEFPALAMLRDIAGKQRIDIAASARKEWDRVRKHLDRGARILGYVQPKDVRAVVELVCIHDAEIPKGRMRALRHGLWILKDFYKIKY